MKYLIWTVRIIVGVLFIFSGLVKANDPMALAYKMNEFFEAWDMTFMLAYSFYFSVFMIALEVVCGVAMLVGNAFRLYSTLLLLLSVFFTFLTAYALYSGKIKECGCFGDCIKISNTATFYKDIVLSVLALFLYIFRYRVFPIFHTAYINTSIVLVGAIIVLGFEFYTLHHLPVRDCLAYKPGTNINEKMQPAPDAIAPVYATTFVYEKDGVKKDFTAENYPWKDSTWKFVSSKTTLVKEGTGQPEIHDFSLTDANEKDLTQQILTAKGYTFLWFVREPDIANLANMDRLHNLTAKAAAMHIPFYVACSADREICNTFQAAWGMKDVPFLIIDGTVSKTVIRTNPGLVLLKDGVVINKWSYLDYPKDMTLDNGNLDLK